jgi:hypothetical protein
MSIRTIIRKGDGVNVEGIASGVLRPGMILERTSTANTFQAHSDDAPAIKTAPYVLLEDELQGKGIYDADGDLETYASGARLPHIRILSPGDRFDGILSNGEVVALGGKVESNGDGKLQAFTSGQIVGVAVSALDLSDSSGADPAEDFITIEVI